MVDSVVIGPAAVYARFGTYMLPIGLQVREYLRQMVKAKSARCRSRPVVVTGLYRNFL